MKKILSLLFSALIASFMALNAQSSVVTFDDFELAPESHFSFDESFLNDEDYTYWSAGNYLFTTYILSEYSSFGGFMLSNLTDTTFDNAQLLEHQFRSAAGPMHENDVYAVLYGGYYNTPIIVKNPEGETVNGMYITNSAWTYSSVVNGDSYTPPFEKGDYFVVKIIGQKMNVNGEDTTYNDISNIEVPLADYRGDKFEVLNTWKWIDLSSLGVVNRINFSFDGSKKNDWGLLTPTYICINDFNAPKPVETKSELVDLNVNIFPNPTVDYLNITGLDGTYSVAMYSLDGVMVYEGSINNFGSIDVSSMTKGVYMLHINGAKGASVQKVIVK